MNYNYLCFYLHALKMGANDASGEGLQYALMNMQQNKLVEIFRNYLLIFSENKDC